MSRALRALAGTAIALTAALAPGAASIACATSSPSATEPTLSVLPTQTPEPAETATTPAPPAATPPAPAASAYVPLIVIDPGHGGPYSNANANGLREKRVNLLIARDLRDALKAKGYRVVLTRNSDRAVEKHDIRTWNYRSGRWSYAYDHRTGLYPSFPRDDLQARVNIANAAGADLFISVHANGARSRSARGYETFSTWRDPKGSDLSSMVQSRVISRTGLKDRGAQYADFYVLRWSNMPAILVEAGFITNKKDAALLKQASFRKKVAKGIASGVDAWMKTSPNERIFRRVSAKTPDEFAVAAAKRSFPTTAPVVVLVRQDRWMDAPGAASLAARYRAPLLFTTESGPSTATAEALATLDPTWVIIASAGEGVKTSASARVAEAAGVEARQVLRLTGADRSALSGVIASRVGLGPGRQVFVIDSADTIAARAVAPVAAALRAPVLLARDGQLAPAAISFIGRNRADISRVVLVGAKSKLPSALSYGLPRSRFTERKVASLAATLNAKYMTSRYTTNYRPVVANSRYGAEYLVSAVRGAAIRQPVIPSYGRVLPVRTRQWITARRSEIKKFEVHSARKQTPLLMDTMLRKADYY